MTKLLAYDVRNAYALSGLTAFRCGPEWRRLPGDGDAAERIGCGPFLALYCEAAKLIVTADMPDKTLDALAEAAEKWSHREWGVEFCAALLSGFDQFELKTFAASTVTEMHAIYEGAILGELLMPVVAPVISTFYTCNGSPKGCERERFGQCGYHDEQRELASC